MGSSESSYLTPSLCFRLLSGKKTISIHPQFHVSYSFPFFEKKDLVSHFSVLYMPVHQIAFSLVQAYISCLCMTFKAMYLSPQHLRGTEHCLTCSSLRNSMVSHSENLLIRQYINLTTVGLAKCVVSWDSGSFSRYTLGRGR